MIQRILLSLSLICMICMGIFFFRVHSLTAAQQSGCIDIAATPDYLSTENAHDAIDAINNARQIEHIRPLHLPENFYRLAPTRQQFILLNMERIDRNLKPLQMDENLSQMAQAYSKQLLELHFFSHTSPISGSFSTRINSNPLIFNHYRLAAENLAGNPVAGVGPIYEYMYNDSTEACGHRQNILDPDLRLVGIGLVPGSIYGSISAQEFLTSAPWSPYVGAKLDVTTPQVTIHATHYKSQRMLSCEAQTSGTMGDVRVTWFLDRVDQPLHVGTSWSLDLHKLSPGHHTVLAYVVDGEQSYGMGQYTLWQ